MDNKQRPVIVDDILYSRLKVRPMTIYMPEGKDISDYYSDELAERIKEIETYKRPNLLKRIYRRITKQ